MRLALYDSLFRRSAPVLSMPVPMGPLEDIGMGVLVDKTMWQDAGNVAQWTALLIRVGCSGEDIWKREDVQC